MTALVSRSPLGSLSMSETQQRATATTASRRRTARYAFDDDDGPPTKRARKEDLKEEVDVGVGENGAKIAEKGRVEKGQRQQQGQQQQQVKTRGNAKGKRSKAGEFERFLWARDGGCVWSACAPCYEWD